MIDGLISPSGYPSVHGDLWHIARADDITKPNFKFIFDVYDTAGNQLIRSKVYPNPATERGYFNAGPIIKNTVTVDWFNPAVAFVERRPDLEGQIGNQYEVRVGEEYSSGNVFVSSLNELSGSTTAYNYFPDLWNAAPSDNISVKFGKAFTNRPLFFKVPFGEKYIMLPIHSTGTLSVSVNIYINKATKVQVNWPSPTFTFTTSAEEGSDFYQLNISPDALAPFAGSPPTFYAEGYYEVTINGTKIRIDFDCKPNYTTIPLHFVNAYGMYDSAYFNLVNKLSLKTNRKSFENHGLTFQTGQVRPYTTFTGGRKYNETKINYDQNVDWSFKLMMENPTDAEYRWLSELIYSPLIYMNYQGNFYPVTIKGDAFEYSEYVFNKLKNFEIEIEVNQNRKGISR
jgi:hypothetical protein